MLPLVISDRHLDALLSVRGLRADGADIERGVRAHCTRLGASESTTTAAINWALREHGSTLDAVRAGNRRADQLHQRSLAHRHPTPA